MRAWTRTTPCLASAPCARFAPSQTSDVDPPVATPAAAVRRSALRLRSLVRARKRRIRRVALRSLCTLRVVAAALIPSREHPQAPESPETKACPPGSNSSKSSPSSPAAGRTRRSSILHSLSRRSRGVPFLHPPGCRPRPRHAQQPERRALRRQRCRTTAWSGQIIQNCGYSAREHGAVLPAGKVVGIQLL